MDQKLSRKFWPYDEVTISLGPNPHQYVIQTPWLSTVVEIQEAQQYRVASLVKKMVSGTMGPEDFAEVSWFFSSLSKYPISYILPLAQFQEGLDSHRRISNRSLKLSPRETLLSFQDSISKNLLTEISNLPNFQGDWKWDLHSSLEMSKTQGGHDPQTLFSIARRFHLLDSVESNQTNELNRIVREMKDQAAEFHKASALIVRQNHYVTEKCDSSLRPALKIAQRAETEVLEFIEAEAGHDSILGKALKSMNLDPQSVPVIEPIQALMELFKYTASQNFLAFSMVVDMFERSSYQEHDPLASLLSEGGQNQAAKQIDIHKDINDAGEHENVALGFLQNMAPVDSDYATEAFQLAELVTDVTHSVSAVLLERIQVKH